jgi:hypothetical protein
MYYLCMQKYQTFLIKMGWAALWAIFVTNSSGHPVCYLHSEVDYVG